jgi:hypothetical protein
MKGQSIEADWDVHEAVDSVRAVGDPEEVKDAAKGGCVIMDKENHVPIKEVLAMPADAELDTQPVEVPGKYQALVAKVEHIWSYASFVVEAKNEDEAANAAYDKAHCPDTVWTPRPEMDWGDFKILVEEKPSAPEYRSWMVDSNLSPYALACMGQAIETVEKNHRYDEPADSTLESPPTPAGSSEEEIPDADIPF